MKVLHVSANLRGGAGVAAARTVVSLKASGVDAELWTSETLGRGRRAKWAARLDSVPQRFFPNRRLFTAWSNAWFPGNVVAKINEAAPDIVHLHWIGHGFVSLAELARIKAPVVWSMHDVWAFTGGCHYPEECVRFADACGSCPQLGSPAPFDLSAWNHRRKKGMRETIRRWIAPSEWIASMGRRSGLVEPGRIRTIPNTLDMGQFTPERRLAARRRMGLAAEDCLFAVGGMELDEVRKGNHLLPAALAAWRRKDRSRNVRLAVFGAKRLPRIEVAGLGIEQTGFLEQAEAVADLLAASDVFILPSLQDNLPNVALEAQACGCPVVGFDAGGLSEIIEPGVTGWLAPEKTAVALGELLADFTTTYFNRREDVSAACRRRALGLFSPGKHAEALRRLYGELVP